MSGCETVIGSSAIRFSLKQYIALVISSWFLFADSVGADVFRWKDAQGNYHYSDKYTPDEAVNERYKIDTTGKKGAQFQEGAKTAEQIAKENRLKELRKEQNRLLVEERDHDESLLRTYRSEDEMVAALTGKLVTLDGIIKVTQTNQQRQEQLLDGQQKQAADLERRGQSVQKGLRDNIDATSRQLATYRDKIRSLELDKTNIKESHGKDVARFRYLQAKRANPNQSLFDWTEPARHVREEPIVSAVKCQSADVCNRIWNLARNYLQQVSNKPLVTDTTRLMRTEAPVNDEDIAVVVVRVLGKDADTLFFDPRCRNSSLGDELCASEKVNELRDGFEPYIRKGLGLAPQ